MNMLNNSWGELKTFEKIIYIIDFICLISIIILNCLQLTRVWEQAINIIIPLLGFNMVLGAIFNWNKYRIWAIVSLCGAIFILSMSVLLFLFEFVF